MECVKAGDSKLIKMHLITGQHNEWGKILQVFMSRFVPDIFTYSTKVPMNTVCWLCTAVCQIRAIKVPQILQMSDE
jgi:hypothetical protein